MALPQRRQQKTWLALSCVERLARLLPRRAAVALGAFLGGVVHFVSRKKVDAAEARCVRALGVGVTTAREIVARSYCNLGRSVMEFYRLPLLSDEGDRLVTVRGEEHLRRAYERGRGVILLCPFRQLGTGGGDRGPQGFPHERHRGRTARRADHGENRRS